MLHKLDIYIIRKFLGTFFFAILLIIGIAVVFDVTERLDDFIEKEAPLNEILFDYYLNFIPYFANLFSSLFTFIAVIFFTSKMAYNTEIIAILSSGVSFRRLMYPFFISALIIAIFSFVLGNFVIPPANSVRLDFTDKYLKNPYKNYDRNIHKQILPGVFFYIESYNTTTKVGQKFSLEKFEGEVMVSKLMADYIRWSEDKQCWEVHNYMIRDFPDKDDFLKNALSKDSELGKKEFLSDEIITTGKLLDTVLTVTHADFSQRKTIVETMDFFELNEFIDIQILQGATNLEFQLIEKYRRISFPFSTFILTLIGVSLASRKTRGGMGMHIGLGIGISFTYILFMQISSQFAIGGVLSPLIAVWIPNLIFALVGVILYIKAPK